LLQRHESIPFTSRDCQRISANRRVPDIARVILHEPLSAELCRVFKRRHLKYDIDGLGIRRENSGARSHGFQARILGVPPLSPKAVPFHLIALRHLDPDKDGLRDATLLIVKRRSLDRFKLRLSLFFRGHQFPGLCLNRQDGQTDQERQNHAGNYTKHSPTPAMGYAVHRAPPRFGRLEHFPLTSPMLRNSLLQDLWQCNLSAPASRGTVEAGSPTRYPRLFLGLQTSCSIWSVPKTERRESRYGIPSTRWDGLWVRCLAGGLEWSPLQGS